jgi:hypothetical protein
LAGLKDQAPEAEKGFSMLTPALKKKMDAQTPPRKTASSRTKRAKPAKARKAAGKRRKSK